MNYRPTQHSIYSCNPPTAAETMKTTSRDEYIETEAVEEAFTNALALGEAEADEAAAEADLEAEDLEAEDLDDLVELEVEVRLVNEVPFDALMLE